VALAHSNPVNGINKKKPQVKPGAFFVIIELECAMFNGIENEFTYSRRNQKILKN